MGYAIIKNKQKPTPAPKQVQYATVERFVEYAETMVSDEYEDLEELLEIAKKSWAEYGRCGHSVGTLLQERELLSYLLGRTKARWPLGHRVFC